MWSRSQLVTRNSAEGHRFRVITETKKRVSLQQDCELPRELANPFRRPNPHGTLAEVIGALTSYHMAYPGLVWRKYLGSAYI